MSPQPPASFVLEEDPLQSALCSLPAARLAPKARVRLWAAVKSAERSIALNDFASMLDYRGERSRWSLATEMSSRLSRFRDVGYRRIRAGARQPSSALEEAMARVLETDGALSARRICDLL